mmetsp:Transcript_24965/g.36903  ORF Transcript_24965/g.36903 Transcript_24965/m.36903 type:complete len:425 (-) Transcript_24965:1263-2537(-)
MKLNMPIMITTCRSVNNVNRSFRSFLYRSSSSSLSLSIKKELCERAVCNTPSQKERKKTLEATFAFHNYFQEIYGEERWDSLGRALLRDSSTAALLINMSHAASTEEHCITKMKEQNNNGVVISQIPWTKPLRAYWADQGRNPLMPPSRLDSGLYNYYCLDPASLLPVLALFGYLDRKTIIEKDEDQNSFFDMAVDFLKSKTTQEKKDGVADIISVLDMCAAPGGKTLAILQAISFFGDCHGTVIANDVSRDRRQRLERVLGQYTRRDEPVLVTNYDGISFGKNGGILPGASLLGTCVTPDRLPFSHVLLDSPCSGERHRLRKNGSLKDWKNNRKNQKRQVALLKAAIASCRQGGNIIYSTCSINPIENDDVVEKVLSKRGDLVSLEELDLSMGEETKFGWIVLPDHPSCLDMGPMYIAALRKL